MDSLFLISTALSKQIRTSLSGTAFLAVRYPETHGILKLEAWLGHFEARLRHGVWELGVLMDGFRLVTRITFSLLCLILCPPQRAVVLPWGCTIKISQSKILHTVLSRWLCLRVGLCIWAPKTQFWRNMMGVLKTSFKRYMTSNYSSFFYFFLLSSKLEFIAQYLHPYSFDSGTNWVLTTTSP